MASCGDCVGCISEPQGRISTGMSDQEEEEEELGAADVDSEEDEEEEDADATQLCIQSTL